MPFWRPPKPPKPAVLLKARLLAHVRIHPGDYLASIIFETGTSPSNARYHLETLEKEGAIVSYHGRRHRRFWPAEVGVPPGPEKVITDIQLDILKKVTEAPGIGYDELAKSIGKRYATVAWNVNTLRDLGKVNTVRFRKTVRIHLPGAVEAMAKIYKVMDLDLPGSPPERGELVTPRVKVLSKTELDIFAGAPVNIDGHMRIEEGHLTVDLYNGKIENRDDAHIESDIFDDSGGGRQRANAFLAEHGIGPIGFRR